jgi:hypothetical protein
MGLGYLDDHPNRVTNGKHLDLIHWSFNFKALAKKSMPKFDSDSRNGLTEHFLSAVKSHNQLA